MSIFKKTPQENTPESKTTKTGKQSPQTDKKSGCCMGTPTCSTTTALTTQPNTALAISNPSAAKKGPKTRVTVKYDVGFNNTLYLRGKGANLSWDKGIPLKNIKRDEWTWETDALFSTCEFKVLVNDKHYETGENHTLTCGASIQYTPKF